MESTPSTSGPCETFDFPRKKRKTGHFDKKEKLTIINVYKHVIESFPKDKYMSKNDLKAKTAEILGISKSAVYRILKEYVKNHTVRPAAKPKKRLSVIDKIDESRIRIIVDSFYLKGELPTSKKVLHEINRDESQPKLGLTSLKKVLKHLKINCVKRRRNNALGPTRQIECVPAIGTMAISQSGPTNTTDKILEDLPTLRYDLPIQRTIIFSDSENEEEDTQENNKTKEETEIANENIQSPRKNIIILGSRKSVKVEKNYADSDISEVMNDVKIKDKCKEDASDQNIKVNLNKNNNELGSPKSVNVDTDINEVMNDVKIKDECKEDASDQYIEVKLSKKNNEEINHTNSHNPENKYEDDNELKIKIIEETAKRKQEGVQNENKSKIDTSEPNIQVGDENISNNNDNKKEEAVNKKYISMPRMKNTCKRIVRKCPSKMDAMRKYTERENETAAKTCTNENKSFPDSIENNSLLESLIQNNIFPIICHINKATGNTELEKATTITTIQEVYFSLAYTAVVALVLPNKNKNEFKENFIKLILKLGYENDYKNLPIEQLHSLYDNMVNWTERQQKQLQSALKNLNSVDSTKTNKKSSPSLPILTSTKTSTHCTPHQHTQPYKQSIRGTGQERSVSRNSNTNPMSQTQTTTIVPANPQPDLQNSEDNVTVTLRYPSTTSEEEILISYKAVTNNETPDGVKRRKTTDHSKRWSKNWAQANSYPNTSTGPNFQYRAQTSTYSHTTLTTSAPTFQHRAPPPVYSNTLSTLPRLNPSIYSGNRNANAPTLQQFRVYSGAPNETNAQLHQPQTQPLYSTSTTLHPTTNYSTQQGVNNYQTNYQGQESIISKDTMLKAMLTTNAPRLQPHFTYNEPRPTIYSTYTPRQERSNSRDSGFLSPGSNSDASFPDQDSSSSNATNYPMPEITHVTSINPAMESRLFEPCHVCKKHTYNKCSQCWRTFYCDTNCLNKDWPTHSKICNILMELNQIT